MSDVPEKSLAPRIKDNIDGCFLVVRRISSQIGRLEDAVAFYDEKSEALTKSEQPMFVEIADRSYALNNYLESLLERLTMVNNKTFGAS